MSCFCRAHEVKQRCTTRHSLVRDKRRERERERVLGCKFRTRFAPPSVRSRSTDDDAPQRVCTVGAASHTSAVLRNAARQAVSQVVEVFAPINPALAVFGGARPATASKRRVRS